MVPIDLQICRILLKGFTRVELRNTTLDLMINLLSGYDQTFTSGNNYLLASIFLILAIQKLASKKVLVQQIVKRLSDLKIDFAKNVIFYFSKVFEFKDDQQFLKAFFKVYSKCFAGERQFAFGVNTFLMFLRECPASDTRFRTLCMRTLRWFLASYGNIWTNNEFLNLLNYALLFGYSEDQELAEYSDKCYSMLLVFAPELEISEFPSLLGKAPTLEKIKLENKQFDKSKILVFIEKNNNLMKFTQEKVFKDAFKKFMNSFN
ncbi:hypothetical protein M0812_03581 [Anaeramoeba flamelloides]|uniref:Uncharacterized protein n=1 Tax=Anaeramoeba flamelloides TaxID=1746091 RepID=A0AAV8AFT1_9EUKA|nr:hypothetical protein M0812_03581 [Anaeramoeba flamelloides]